MAVRRTWWIKLGRAKKHLDEFHFEFTKLREQDAPYGVVSEIHADQQGRQFIQVRAYGWALPNDGDDIAAIVGDIVFNLRSAMDHICVVLTRNDEAQFPILRSDIWKRDIDPTTGKDRNKPRRDGFKENTKRMPPGALAIVKALQPYVRIPERPENDPLAIVNRISNADKHRTLMTVSQYILTKRSTVEVSGYSPIISEHGGRKGRDGAVILSRPVSWPPDAEVHVEASGGIEIGLKESASLNWDWELPATLDALYQYVWREVLFPLDGFIR